MSNQNVGQLFFTVPNGMAIMPHVIAGQWLIMFAYKDVEHLKAFTAKLAEDAAKVTVNVKHHVLAPPTTKCQHPEAKRHISEKGVFCLQCNEPVLVALEPTGFSQQESVLHPAMVQGSKSEETEEEGPETPRDIPVTEKPVESLYHYCPYCGKKYENGVCENGHPAFR